MCIGVLIRTVTFFLFLTSTFSVLVFEVSNMICFCPGEAAEKFKVSPRDSSSNEPNRQPNGIDKVYGQDDTLSTTNQMFVCAFNANGVCNGVQKN